MRSIASIHLGWSFRQRAVLQVFAAGFLEDLAALAADLVERLQAIRGEARQRDVDALHALLRQFRQHVVGVRLEPLLAAEPRLIRLRPAARAASPVASTSSSRGAFDVRWRTGRRFCT